MEYTKEDVEKIPYEKIAKLLNDKITKLPKKRLSKNDTFEAVIDSQGKIYPDGIPEEIIIQELVKTGIFDKLQAEKILKKYCQGNYLYEPKPGFFIRV